MIRNFRDHAANERTFLAWVRTAIAVMAFGFLIERFDLLLKAAGLSSHAPRAGGLQLWKYRRSLCDNPGLSDVQSCDHPVRQDRKRYRK